ncbi:M16 family metallopeptidase [Planctobacterium marinum]|uniref:Peptidase M16 n=1 Tax=Planctobacterium marinum TaxID=1631968 RepID=A0AA48KR65_9ALTE|nr:hypothetical protein MACH26_13130 [Planctobacterium marinum]
MKSIIKTVTAVAASISLASCMVVVDTNSKTKDGYSNKSSFKEQAKSSETKKVFTQDYVLEELDNGLKVMVVKTDYPDLVSLQIPVSAGSRDEVEKGKTGFAHFFEHMMFKGSKKFPDSQYTEVFKSAGVDYGGYTTNDYTNYHADFSKQHLETVLEILADHFQNLHYTEAQFRTEALTVKGEYLKNNASPIRKLLSAVRKEAYDVHTYEHTTMGFFEDIEAMPDQMAYGQEFFNRFYKPEYVSLVIAGDVDPKATLDLIKQYWGDWERGDFKSVVPQEPEQTAPRYFHEKYDGLPGHWLLVSYKGAPWIPNKKDRAGLDLLSELYFSDNSDLYQELVVDKQIASQMFTYNPNTKDTGLRHVFVKVQEEADLVTVRDAINRTYAKARTELVDDEKLANLKSNLKYSFVNSLDSSEAIASTLTSYMHFKRDPEVINELYQSFDKITAQDIKNLANQYYIDSNRTTVTLSALDAIAGFEQEVSLEQLVVEASVAPPAPEFTIVDRTNSSPLIDINILFYTGAAAEPEGKKGVAALTASMLTQGGSESKTFKEIQQKLYPLAGSFNAQLDKEMMSFTGRVHQDNVAQWYALISDQILNPGWREDDFKRVKKELLDAIKSSLKSSNDEELGKEVLYHELYQGHVYESYNLGDISDIEALTIDDLKAFYASQLTQAKLQMGLTGAIPSAIKAKIKQDFARLPKGEEDRLSIAKAPVLKGKHATIVEKNAQSTAVSFGFPIDVNRSSEDWAALWLARSYLGEHRSSNSYLFKRIRAVRGMNYGDYAYIEYYPRGMFRTKPNANLGRSSQIFQVWIRPLRSNNDAHFATRVALFELDKLIENGMTQEDFEATRNFLLNFAPQLVSSQDMQLGYALDSEFYGIDDFVSHVKSELEKLSVDDVNRVIKKHLQTENIHYVFVSGDAEDMKNRLATEMTSPLEYNSEKPEELLAEDRIIQDYKLSIPASNISVVPVDEVFK